MSASPVLAGLVAATLLMWEPEAAGTHRQATTVSAADLLEYYEAGEYEVVQHALQRAATGDLGVVLDTLKREAGAWIDADGPRWRNRRRMIVATVALETARASLDGRWDRSRALLDWSADLLAKTPPSPAERIWQQAALAIYEGARDVAALDGQIARMTRRFPDDPRPLLARAFVSETQFWDENLLFPGRADADRAARPLQAVLSQSAIRNEALLRLGYLALYAGRPEQALAYLRRISGGGDAGQAYLAGLFAGWAHERLLRSAEAAQDFKAALAAAPHARTASLSLSVALYVTGARAEADHVLDEDVLQPSDPAKDPWTEYGYGDLRRFPMLIDQLRSTLK